MAAGVLVLVVGPSGAGKDTLIRLAQQQLAEDERFWFVRRVVTRPAVAALEDHDSLTIEDFAAALERGEFALHWHAHGLCYGLPASLDSALAAGRVVVVNGARRALAEALRRHPTSRVVVITAATEVRAERLLMRGRESAAEIAARLQREGEPVDAAVRLVEIDNSGDLDSGVAAFVAALRSFAGN